MKNLIRKLVRKAGWDIVSFNPCFNAEARKAYMLQRLNINHVLDVGANIGQFGLYLRSIGYRGYITSFEPMKNVFPKLEYVSGDDSKWKVINIGLGSKEEESLINISQNSYSSSIKQVLPRHLEAHPDSTIVGQETIKLSTVDNIFRETVGLERNVMLKIDTQGYEGEVLEGAKRSLGDIKLIVMEMSLEPLYSGQELFSSLIDKMNGLGFKVLILEPCDEDYKSLTILQMDGWFIKL